MTMVDARYAVICAPHVGNAGMFSVDLAARNFFSGRGVDFDLFLPQKNEDTNLDEYRLVSSLDELKVYSHVIYWGDFLTNPIYGYGDFPRRSIRWNLSDSKPEAVRRWKSIFNPVKSDSSTAFLVIGGNFQHDFGKYGRKFDHVFKRLERSMRTVFVRDPLSCQSLSRQFTHAGMQKIICGIDCAFLQDVPPPRVSEDDCFVYFFKRSKLKDPIAMVRAIEDRTGIRGIELSSWLRLDRASWHSDFAALKDRLTNARFAVTDTYHLCINAMHSRCPVFGIGRSQPEQIGTIGDLKKKVLFDMFDLGDFYIEFEDQAAEEGLSRAVSDRIAWYMADRTRHDDMFLLVEARTRQFARSIERALDLPVTEPLS